MADSFCQMPKIANPFSGLKIIFKSTLDDTCNGLWFGFGSDIIDMVEAQ